MRQVNSKRFGYIIAIALISAMLIQPTAPRPTDSGAHGGAANGAPSVTRFASLPLSFEPRQSVAASSLVGGSTACNRC